MTRPHDAAKRSQYGTQDLEADGRSASELHRQDLVRSDYPVSGLLGVGELGVLALEVGFRHPTGDRAAPSNVDRDLVLQCRGKQLFEGRPANGN